jgi:cytochrome c oxidase assembly protein Cox11
MKSRKAFTVGSIVAVVVGLIVLVAVAVPITTNIVSTQNFTGTNATIANILTTLMLVGAILLVVSLYSSN